MCYCNVTNFHNHQFFLIRFSFPISTISPIPYSLSTSNFLPQLTIAILLEIPRWIPTFTFPLQLTLYLFSFFIYFFFFPFSIFPCDRSRSRLAMKESETSPGGWMSLLHPEFAPFPLCERLYTLGEMRGMSRNEEEKATRIQANGMHEKGL